MIILTVPGLIHTPNGVSPPVHEANKDEDVVVVPLHILYRMDPLVGKKLSVTIVQILFSKHAV